MLELSVSELNERAKGSSNKRLPFKYIPAEIVQTVKEHLRKTGNVEKILRYILNAFYIYRESVCMEFLAPHYEVGEAFEWPSPARFSWSNIEAVILGGEYVYGKIPKEEQSVVIETKRESVIESKLIDLETNTITTYIRDIILGKDNLNETLKYKIENMSKVGFIFQQDWQLNSLKTYANPIYFLLKDFLEGKIKKEEARKNIEIGLKNLGQSFID